MCESAPALIKRESVNESLALGAQPYQHLAGWQLGQMTEEALVGPPAISHFHE